MKRVLITPVKNEAHYLPSFIEHHLQYFDKIVIADQRSTDNSWEISTSYNDVVAIKNNSESYDERQRRLLLIHEARKIDKKPFVVGLDADEFLLLKNSEWDSVTELLCGQYPDHSVQFDWMALRPGGQNWSRFKHTFCSPSLTGELPEGFIHIPRVPLSEKSVHLKSPIVLHLNLYFPKRQQMKTWWYMAMEAIKRTNKNVDLNRIYQRSATGDSAPIEPVSKEYETQIQSLLTHINREDTWDTWHKNEIIQMLSGTDLPALQNIDIWKYPWDLDLRAIGYYEEITPPLSHQIIFQWFRKTRKCKPTIPIRLIDRLLRTFID